MSNKSSGRLVIPQWGIVSRVVTAFDLLKDEYDVELSRTRSDLTNATLHLTVEDINGNVVIQKTSANPAEILKLDQLVEETKGQARVFFIEADTAALIAGAEYWFDCWSAEATPNEEPIVDRGRFIVSRSVTHISIGAAPFIPIAPAPQIPQIRSFRWVAPSDGNSFTVIIPGTGMVDDQYHIEGSIRSGVLAASMIFQESLSTETQFNVVLSGSIPAGTVITFLLRDM